MERLWLINPKQYINNHNNAKSTHQQSTTTSLFNNNSILCTWSSLHYNKQSMCLATTTTYNNNIYIYNIHKQLVFEFVVSDNNNNTNNYNNTNTHTQQHNNSDNNNTTHNATYTIQPNTYILQLQWSYDGNILAILCGQPMYTILLLDINTLIVSNIVDINTSLQSILYDTCIIQWHKTSYYICIGCNNGYTALINIIYNNNNITTIDLLWHIQRHYKKILCIEFNNNDKLATISDDKLINIISIHNNKLYGQVRIKNKPNCIKFGSSSNNNILYNSSNNYMGYNIYNQYNNNNIFNMFNNNNTYTSNTDTTDSDNMIAVSMDKKTILLYNLNDAENALELAFQSRYGYILSYHWLYNIYIMITFSNGYFVIISTQAQDIGREQFCGRFIKDNNNNNSNNSNVNNNIIDICYHIYNNILICICDYSIKIINIHNWTELYNITLHRNYGSIEYVNTTQYNNIITLITNKQYIITYVVNNSLLPHNINNISNTFKFKQIKSIINAPISINLLLLYMILSTLLLLSMYSFYTNLLMYDVVYDLIINGNINLSSLHSIATTTMR